MNIVTSHLTRSIYFVLVGGAFFELRLINVHLHYGDNTVTEIEKRQKKYEFLLDRIYPSISMERRYGKVLLVQAYKNPDVDMKVLIQILEKLGSKAYVTKEKKRGFWARG